MNWAWLVINLILIVSAILSEGLVDLAIELGKESHLGLLGAISVLVTPFAMVIYLQKYKYNLLKIILILLNALALIFSGEIFIKYFEPSTNAMWLIAVFLPLIWFAGSSTNLRKLLKPS